MEKAVYLPELPNCDICKDGTKAEYDAKTVFGVWAYLCRKCFSKYGIGLGIGKGQKLVRRED